MPIGLDKLAEDFEAQLRLRARHCGWSTVPNPRFLGESERSIDKLVSALSPSRPEARSLSPLPAFRRAFDLRPASLSLLLCGLEDGKPDESYRSALCWTGLVRSEIEPSRRSDLHLFLIAPSGTSSELEWHSRRSRIEADERFCRKFVWLPSDSPAEAEIDAFLDRTFLAQPWESTAVEPRSLDPIARLVEEADIEGLLTTDEALEWIRCLGSTDATKGQMAEELVSILEDKSR